MIDGISDLTTKFVTIIHESDHVLKQKMAADLIGSYLPFWLSHVDKRIKENNQNNKFLVGDKITIADFAMGAMIFSVFSNPANEYAPILTPIINGSENFKIWIENFHNDHKEYFDSRPQPRPY